MAAVMDVPVTAMPVRVATVAPAALASVGVTGLVTGVRVARAVKTVARAWVMPLSVPSAMRWSAPRCRCANWPRKPTAKH